MEKSAENCYWKLRRRQKTLQTGAKEQLVLENGPGSREKVNRSPKLNTTTPEKVEFCL